jgi:endonuclease YncB( thermonuclease family)
MHWRAPIILGAFAAGVLAGALIQLVTGDLRSDLGRFAPAGAGMAQAAPQSAAAFIKGAYGAEVLRVIDGDTFEARVHLWPGLAMTTRVRLRGIDAPELNAHCAEERSKAEAARDALRSMLDGGDLTMLRVGLDKYGGRVLADAATARIPDVSAALRDQGLARPYAGGRRESWCGG